jgi:hypothetical protein
VPHRMPAARDTAAENQIVQSRCELRVHGVDLNCG